MTLSQSLWEFNYPQCPLQVQDPSWGINSQVSKSKGLAVCPISHNPCPRPKSDLSIDLSSRCLLMSGPLKQDSHSLPIPHAPSLCRRLRVLYKGKTPSIVVRSVLHFFPSPLVLYFLGSVPIGKDSKWSHSRAGCPSDSPTMMLALSLVARRSVSTRQLPRAGEGHCCHLVEVSVHPSNSSSDPGDPSALVAHCHPGPRSHPSLIVALE